MDLRRALPTALVAVFALPAFPAFADEPPPGLPALPAPPASASARPLTPSPGADVVRTRDGRSYRGTIVEREPSGNVTIQVVTGATHTLAMADVAYAGPYPEPPAAQDPTPPSPPDATAARPVATVKANEVPVRVVSDQPHVGLHVRAGQSHGVGTTWLAGTPGGMGITAITAQHYNDLCTAPCELSMAVGEYRFGVSQGGGRVQETGEPVRLRGPATLHVEYESRAAYRVVGWTLVAASAVAGTYLFAEGSRLRYDEKQVGTYSDGSPRTERVERPKQEAMVWSGVAIGVVGVTVGLVLALLQDHAEVTVESPKTAPGPRARLVADGIAGEF